jgi:hypothetical protein
MVLLPMVWAEPRMVQKDILRTSSIKKVPFGGMVQKSYQWFVLSPKWCRKAILRTSSIKKEPFGGMVLKSYQWFVLSPKWYRIGYM